MEEAAHNSLHFFSFLQQKEINFLLIEWNQRIRELFDWIWLKDIITVLYRSPVNLRQVY